MHFPSFALSMIGGALASPLNDKRAAKPPAFFLAGDSTTAAPSSGGGGMFHQFFFLQKPKLIVSERMGKWVPRNAGKWSKRHQFWS
jgi:hypothetical protein